jgi:regulatory protein
MRVINLLSRRVRSEWELRNYLKLKDYSQEIIDSIIKKLSNKNLVNDLEFARRWIENRRLLKNVSKQRLKMELRQKRIDSEIITKVLSEDETTELEVLQNLVERKKVQSRYKDQDKLVQYLLRQGFNYQDIKQVLSKN